MHMLKNNMKINIKIKSMNCTFLSKFANFISIIKHCLIKIFTYPFDVALWDPSFLPFDDLTLPFVSNLHFWTYLLL